MGGVEGEGAEVAEGADFLVSIGGAECIAAVFDQPEAMLVGNRADFFNGKGIA